MSHDVPRTETSGCTLNLRDRTLLGASPPPLVLVEEHPSKTPRPVPPDPTGSEEFPSDDTSVRSTYTSVETVLVLPCGTYYVYYGLRLKG